tara:strand:+ start:1997 stop:2188 length:192 start_codon:yes stop_codon:yes gene_type:complete
MKSIISLLIISFSYCSYYSIGDTLDYDRHNPPLEICAGNNSGSTIYLSDYIGKIIVIGITASW